MNQPITPAAPDEKIVHHAHAWRRFEKDAIANKQDRDKQRAEYRARQDLRKAIDEAGQP